MKERIGREVQGFYNKTPFPDYDLNNFNTKEDLILSAYPFAKILDRSIPADASIIDIGCGTGQLSAFLSLRRDCVYGIDFSDSSLNKARKLKEKLNLNNLHLRKIDILNTEEIESIRMKFDYVLCLGVLHHTANAYQGFADILKLLKPDGHIAIGLYNRYGRMPLRIRKLLAKTIFRNNNKIKDYFIRLQIGETKDKERARGWWNDQYNHPHETTHTIGEVLKWFKKNDIRYLQTVPSLNLFDSGDLEISGVWNEVNEIYPNFLIRFYKQFVWIWKIHKEGGYWITFGKNKKLKLST